MGRSSSKMLSHPDVDGTEVADAKQICDKFNVNNEIPSNNSSMYLWHTTESEVLAAAKNLKKNGKINDISKCFLSSELWFCL